MDYQEAQALFERARNPENGKPLCNNTRLYKREFEGDEYFAVRLHETDVVDIFPDGTYRLRTGGWYTRTTKDRINTYGPGLVFSDKGVWYLRTESDETFPFPEDLFLHSTGRPVKPSRLEETDDLARKKRALDRKVNDYIKAFVADCKEKRSLPQPGPGDCWACRLEAKDHDEHKPYGLHMGASHLLRHIEENYFVGSLLYNAVRSRGMGNDGLMWNMMASDAHRGNVRDVDFHLRNYFKRVKQDLFKAYLMDEPVEA